MSTNTAASVEWRDPRLIAAHYAFTLRVVHLSLGIYFWEYISTFGFEWEIYTKRRPFKWPSLIYIGSRFCGLVVCLDLLAGYNTTHEINCLVWWKTIFGFSFISLELATALLCLRVIAFWQRHTAIVVIVGILYGANVVSLVYGGIQTYSEWDDYLIGCLARRTATLLPVAGLFLVTDSGLFFLMLFGLWKIRASGSLWVLARQQGFTWVLAAALVEVPVVVLLRMNLNEPLNLLLQLPYMVIMVICATRMYRSMCLFSEGNTVHISQGMGLPTIASGIAFARNPNIDHSTTVALGPSDNLLESGLVNSLVDTTRTKS